MDRLKTRTEPPRVPVPLQPSVFTVDPSQDVRSWPQSTEMVFLGTGVSSLADKLRMICAFVEGPAALFLASVPDVDSWEHFKQIWIGLYTLYGTDVKNRLHFHANRQETDDVEQYICELARRLDLVTNPSEQEVLMVFLGGMYEEIQQNLLQTQVTNMVDAFHRTMAFHLAHSLTLRDAAIPREMHFERLQGSHVTAVELNRISSRSSRSSSQSCS